MVAHQDDDILFMNPDLANAITARLPVTTVFLTAGEGYATPSPEPDIPAPNCRPGYKLDREQYSACRNDGARAAYALMLGFPDADAADWRTGALTVNGPNGLRRQVEFSRAERDGRVVNLIFVNLPEWADKHADTKADPADPTSNAASLFHLWQDNSRRVTVVPAGSPVRARQSYDREDLINLLIGLCQRFQPTVVRVQDPRPDLRHGAADRLHDHRDHVSAARLAILAVRRLPATQRVAVITYRGYNIQHSPVNLDAGQQRDKDAQFAAYAQFDQQITNTAGYRGWPQRLYHRYWGGTNWVARTAAGRLQAFAVHSGGLRTWWQDGESGWLGPRDLGDPGGPLAPAVSVTREEDGRLRVFALRLDTFQVVCLTQSRPDGDWPRRWASLGNPHGKSRRARQIGQPVVVAVVDGGFQVFLQNGDGGLSTRTARGWQDLGGGPGVQDGLAAITDARGRIEVFALAVEAGSGVLKRWHQTESGAAFRLDPDFPGLEPAGPPTVALSADGTLDVVYRLAGEHAGKIGHTWQTRTGEWIGKPEILDGHGGIGPIAAASAPHPRHGIAETPSPRITLCATNRYGGVSATRQSAPDLGYLDWTDLGGLVVHQPALAVDPSGRTHLFAVSGDGKLLHRRQIDPGGDAPYTGWTRLG
ncbi:PIG-L family deacetylase [Crossiella sp. S99.2]|uniref:PIG-L family deacetylase n=1 Tax=Crossiella sp. S99.2 TaxID=2936272 RepID=UPI001FFFD0E0|nr:PIG-L family deacetylase [Crossiella sp. S99.2]MCK2257645.1 PIG-L family deacetylase [Crossiella sp. S99.1]